MYKVKTNKKQKKREKKWILNWTKKKHMLNSCVKIAFNSSELEWRNEKDRKHNKKQKP